MVKTNYDNNTSWRHRDAKFCRDCNCSVGSAQWLSHLSKRSHTDNARNRRNLDEMHSWNMNGPAPQPSFSLKEPLPIIDQIRSFKDQVIMRSEDCNRIEADIFKDLKPLLGELFGNCKLHSFGSMKTGLALIGSDVDVYVEIGNEGYRENIVPSEWDIRRNVYQCSSSLSKSKHFALVEAIYDAKVPIVNVTHLRTKTKCDISFTTPIGMEQGTLLRFYFNFYPSILDLTLVIKFWAKKHGICNGRTFISSYGWTLLFISYLQTVKFADGKPVIPSVLDIQADDGRIKEVHGCRVDFHWPYPARPLPNETKFSHLGLLKGFFTYYSTFSFRSNVVCPFLGMPVSRIWASAVGQSNRVLFHTSALRANTKAGMKFLRIIQDPLNHKAFVVCPVNSLPRLSAKIEQAARVCEEEMRRQSSRSRFLETLFFC